MSDDWWDDFANNLATDFAPLVALFGDAPTKQYLSECLTAADILIFATAPLGIVTAIVSAIRVCGTPSLRAFIGRAQEGAGNAEAELCSSTSRDVCELYNNGGIARVLGRPKLLEIIYDSKASAEDFFPDTKGMQPNAGIYSFEEFKKEGDKKGDCEWKEVTGRTSSSLDYVTRQRRNSKLEKRFAPNPNLSLNVGIKPRANSWFYAAAVIGVVLQSAVLVWATIARYQLRLVRNDVQEKYAVPLTIIGTMLLGIGVGLCAFLIERSTKERVFERNTGSDSSATPSERPQRLTTRIYWVQPGNQAVGDQVFDSFAYTNTDPEHPTTKYTTSWKDNKLEETATSTMKLIWTAVLSTFFGFIIQFIGLRACHSSVSLAQLAVTIVMSIIRASLRTQRMEKKDNLAKDPGLFQGHELDWLALEISLPENLQAESNTRQRLWEVFSHDNSQSQTKQRHGCLQQKEHGFLRELDNGPESPGENPVCCVSCRRNSRVALIGFWHFNTHDTTTEAISRCCNWRPYYPKQKEKGSAAQIPAATRAFLHRARLARMTDSDDIRLGESSRWGQVLVSVRHTAQLLSNAIDTTAGVLFETDTTGSIQLFENWENCFAIYCPIDVTLFDGQDNFTESDVSFSLSRKSRGLPWQVNKAELEAILGLWVWSLRNRPGTLTQTSSVLSSRLYKESAFFELDPWHQKGIKDIKPINLKFSLCHQHPDAQADSTKYVQLQNALWWRDGGNFVMKRNTEDEDKKHVPPEEANEIRQFFGLQYLDLSKASSRPQKLLELTSVKSLVLACAQELYSKFFDAIMLSVKGLGGTSEARPGYESFRFANENLDRLYTAFIQSGLGSPEDAFACITPVLHTQKKLPSMDSILPEVRKRAEGYSSKGDWTKASDLLEWAHRCFNSSSDISQNSPIQRQNEHRLLIFALCECYWKALGDRSNGKPDIIHRLNSLLGSECPRLITEGTPFLYVHQSAPSERLSDDRYGTLARVLIDYAIAVLWITDDHESRNNFHRTIVTMHQRLQDHQVSEPDIVYKAANKAKLTDLHKAIKGGDLSSALYLLRREDAARAIQVSYYGRTAFSYAVEKGWLNVVKALKDPKVDINAEDGYNRSSLYYAAQSGDINTFNYLLSNGASPTITTKNSRTALDCAVDAGHLTIIEALLDDQRVDPNKKDKDGRTPLSRAVRKGEISAARKLLSSDRVDMNSSDPKRMTPLMLAVANGKNELVTQLVQHERVNIQAKDSKGRTVLSQCAYHGRSEWVHLLLKRDASLASIRDNSGRSPLSLAVTCTETSNEDGVERDESNCPYNYHDTIETLLSYSEGEANHKDNHGKTPLFHAVSSGQRESVTQLLAKSFVDPNATGKGQSTPLALAVKKGSKNIVQCLVKSKGIDLEQGCVGMKLLSNAAARGWEEVVFTVLSQIPNIGEKLEKSGHHPLISCVTSKSSSRKIVEMLIENGVDPDKCDGIGRTPLSYAAEEDRKEILDYLLSNTKVSKDPTDNEQRTPLSYAAAKHNLHAVTKLLSIDGVDPESTDISGKTPLLYAVFAGDVQRRKNAQPKVGNTKKDANVVESLLHAKKIDPNRTFTERRYLAIHAAAVIGYEEAVGALLPWVRPRERPAIKSFLEATGMDGAWSRVADSNLWQHRSEEPEEKFQSTPTEDLLMSTIARASKERFSDVLAWARR